MIKATPPNTPYLPIILESHGRQIRIFLRRCNNINFQVEYRCICPRYTNYLAKGFTAEDAVRLMFDRIDVAISVRSGEKYL